MEKIIDFLSKAVEHEVSDIFIIPGAEVRFKRNGRVDSVDDKKMMPEDTKEFVSKLCEYAKVEVEDIYKNGDVDFAFAIKNVSRFRCSAYLQRGSLAAVIRIVTFGIPDSAKMKIPKEVLDLYKLKSGMILVTGSVGSGKSTTLACLIDKINTERYGHIITLEDPIEYLYQHKRCLVSQREIPHDSKAYAPALRAALRQAPNVILIGEMRDTETAQAALSAAETGQLILSTLHTNEAGATIERIIDMFPANQQHQIRTQVATVLKAVVSQRLIHDEEGKVIPAFGFMRMNPAIQNLVRENKTHQIANAISTAQGMWSIDEHIMKMYKNGVISREVAIQSSIDPDKLRQKLGV